MDADRCDCPHQHPTPDGRCANPSLRSEDPERLARYSKCGCCMADCPDVHPEPVGINIVPGTDVVSAEHVATLTAEQQAVLRERAAAGDLRVVPRAEMNRDAGRVEDMSAAVESGEYTAAGPLWIAADFVATLPAEDQERLRERAASGAIRIVSREAIADRFRSDAADTDLAAAIAESEEIYEAEQVLESAGIQLPPPDPASMSMPNLGTPEVSVRFSAATLAALSAAAARRNCGIDSIIRSAVLGWLRQHPPED